MAALLDRGETRMRAAIGGVPDGDYANEGYMDHSGTSPEPLLVRLTLAVRAGGIHADFSGSALQVPGPTNVGPAHAATAVYTMAKAFLYPTGPINSGAFRPISVFAPEGTIVNARPTAACGAIGDVRRTLESLVIGALGRAVPARMIGDLKGASNITTIGGSRPHPFVCTEFPAGGTGAFAGADGNNTMRNFAEGDNPSIQPVEAIEHTFPLEVVRSALREDSGGDGRWRGGLGLRREIVVRAPEATLSVLSDKNVIPPYGVRAGGSGAPNRFAVRRGGAEIEPSVLPGKVTGFRLREGDVVVMRTAGGGYGDPLEREPAEALRDVRFGYVSAARARAVYGVVLDGDAVDEPATARLRRRLRAGRRHLRVVPLPGSEHDAMRRIAALAPATARRLRIRAGALVGLPSASGPSLRAWARLDPALPEGVCALGAGALAMLGLEPEARVELRPIRVSDV
jgi:N-methylhydantoinase B